MREPDFFIVGQTRSGTTSLQYQLQQHPDVFLIPKMYSGISTIFGFNPTYVSLFVMPDKFLKARYRTRSVTGPWRSMQLYINIWKYLQTFCIININLKNLST